MAVQINVVGKWDGKDIEKAKKQLASLGGVAETSAKKSDAGFKSMTVGLKGMFAVAAGAGVVTFLKGAIDSAGELQDTLSASQQIFGSASGDIEQFGKNAAVSMGLSENAAIDAADGFAVFAKSAGLTNGKAADFAKTLTQLGGDMASFYGGDVSDAVDAIGSALRGEMEPIRKYNVLLDDATLRQQALSMGLIKTTKDALTPQQKVLAAQAAIIKQTSLVTGDYTRTAGQFSNMQRTMSAEWQNTTTQIGTAFLPIMTSAVHISSQGLTVFNQIPAPLKVIASVMIGASVAGKLLGGRLDGLTSAARGIPNVARSIGSAWQYAGDAANKSSGGVGTFTQKLGAMKKIMGTTGMASSALKGAAGGLLSMLGGPWGIAIGGATLAVTAYMNAQQNAQAAVDALSGSLDNQSGAMTAASLEKISQALGDDITSAQEWATLNKQGFSQAATVAALAQGGKALDDYNAKLWESRQANLDTRDIVDALRSSVDNQASVIHDAKDSWTSHTAAVDAAKVVQQQITPPVNAQTAAIKAQKAALTEATTAYSKWSALLDVGAARDAFTTGLRAMGEAAKAAKGKFEGNSAATIAWRDSVRSSLGDIKSMADLQGTAAGKAKVLSDGMAGVRGALTKMKVPQSVIDSILKPFDQMAGRARSAGAEISNGVATGILSTRAKAIAEAFNLGAAAVQAVRRGADVNSPSRYTHWVGTQVVDGLTAGVISKAGGAKKIIADATSQAMSGAQEALDAFHAKGQTILDFINGIKGSVISGGGIASGGVDGKTSGSVIGDMRAKVQEAQAFAKAIGQLRKSKLNNTSLQEIIAAGPHDGLAIAKALIAGGAADIATVNHLEGLLGNAAQSIGDTGGLSQYGRTGAEAKGITTTTINAKLELHIGKGANPADVKEINDEVQKKWDDLVKQLRRELAKK